MTAFASWFSIDGDGHKFRHKRRKSDSRNRRRVSLGADLWLEYRVLLAAIPIYSTGVGNDNNLLPAGSVDRHYQLISSPDPSFSMAFVAGIIPGTYIPNGPNSQWIGPGVDQGPITIYPAGDYVYRTTFDVTGFEPSSTVITGQFASDNPGIILLNGADTGIKSPDYTAWTPFSLTSGFVSGLNTLDFRVTNFTHATALHVELSGTVNPIPVPPPPPPLQLPDLVVDQFNVPQFAVVGQTIGISWSVRDASRGDAIGPWTDAILPVGRLDARRFRLAPGRNPFSGSGRPGGRLLAERLLSLPPDVGPGYYVLLRADDGQALAESREDDNSAGRLAPAPVEHDTIVPVPSPLADLTVPSVRVSPTASPGGLFKVDWTVTNVGDGHANGDWFRRPTSRSTRTSIPPPIPCSVP